MDTQWSSESRLEHSVEASGRIVLECSGCGEELLLLGLEEDWPKEGRPRSQTKLAGAAGPQTTLPMGMPGIPFYFSPRAMGSP